MREIVKKLLALCLLLTLLPACRPIAAPPAVRPPSPTPSGTPTAFFSPTPSATASPTAMPSTTPTVAPTAPATPTASAAAATPTLLATVTATPPAGWARYAGSRISLEHPAGWDVRDVAPNSVTFGVSPVIELTAGVYAPACGIESAPALGPLAPCLLERMRAAYAPRDEFVLLDSGVRADGGASWYYAEYSLLDYISKQTRYLMEAYRAEAGALVGCTWRDFAGRVPGDAERAVFWTVAASLQIVR